MWMTMIEVLQQLHAGVWQACKVVKELRKPLLSLDGLSLVAYIITFRSVARSLATIFSMFWWAQSRY